MHQSFLHARAHTCLHSAVYARFHIRMVRLCIIATSTLFKKTGHNNNAGSLNWFLSKSCTVKNRVVNFAAFLHDGRLADIRERDTVGSDRSSLIFVPRNALIIRSNCQLISQLLVSINMTKFAAKMITMSARIIN